MIKLHFIDFENIMYLTEKGAPQYIYLYCGCWPICFCFVFSGRRIMFGPLIRRLFPRLELRWPMAKYDCIFVHFNDQLSPRQCPHGHFLQWSNRTHQICRLGQNPNETQAKCQSSYEALNKTNDTTTKSFLATSLQSKNYA